MVLPLKTVRGRDNQNSAMPLLPVCYSRDDVNRCCQLPSPVSMKGQGETPILIQGAVIRWSGAHGIGIQFQSLTSPNQERLTRIDRIAPQHTPRARTGDQNGRMPVFSRQP